MGQKSQNVESSRLIMESDDLRFAFMRMTQGVERAEAQFRGMLKSAWKHFILNVWKGSSQKWVYDILEGGSDNGLGPLF